MKRFPAFLLTPLIFLVGHLTFALATDAVQVSGVVDGKKLQLTPELQKRLIEESVKLLASCSNTVVQPHRRLEDVKSRSQLHFLFAEPRSFDLGIERRPGTTNVLVKEMVIELPLSSGGTWISSTLFRWFCSKYDSRTIQEIEEMLKPAQKL